MKLVKVRPWWADNCELRRYVPVLAVRGDRGKLLGVLFGYACHPTTLSFNTWCDDYPVQAWQIGNELLLIGIGREAVVNYSLRFKREFGPTTWVCGYANDMAAYIPSRRVWEEGGYEGGPHLDEYGRPAWRWAGDVEDRIAGAVHRVVENVRRGE